MGVAGPLLDPGLVQQLQGMQLTARSVVLGSSAGAHRSPIRGASIEFRQHRIYAPGDEPRRLDWRVLARTDRPFVKEYEQETNLRCLVMLDASGSMAYGRKFGSKFDYAARLAAALAYLMLGRTETVGLACYREKLDEYVAPHSGTGQLARVIDVLQRAEPRGPSSPRPAMLQALTRLERRALIVVISDFLTPVDEIALGLASLKHQRHEVIALRLLDADEREFPFGPWVRLRGLEGEGAVVCEPAVVRRHYLDAFARHATALDDACKRLYVELATMPTDRPLIDNLGQFLARRAGRTGAK